MDQLKTLLYSKYVCVNVKNKTWYKFDTHRWVECNYGRYFIKELKDIFKHFMSEIISKEYRISEIEVLNQEFSKILAFSELDCAKYLYDQEFLNKLDIDKSIICFNNGVYDFRNHIFRKGNFQDYISLSTNYDYIPLSLINYNIKIDFVEFISLILEWNDFKRFFLYSISNYFNENGKSINIFYGEDLSGLSLIKKILKLSFGDYLLNNLEEFIIIDKDQIIDLFKLNPLKLKSITIIKSNYYPRVYYNDPYLNDKTILISIKNHLTNSEFNLDNFKQIFMSLIVAEHKNLG